MSGRLRWLAGGLRREPLCCLEEEEAESLAGGAGCQGQEQARRAAIRLLETIDTCTATTCQHTALSVWHGWVK